MLDKAGSHVRSKNKQRKDKHEHKKCMCEVRGDASTSTSVLVLASSWFTHAFSCASACVVRVNQPLVATVF